MRDCVGVQGCVHSSVEAGGKRCVSLLGSHPPWFLETGDLVGLDHVYTAAKSQGSTSFCLPSAGITVHLHAQLFVWVQGFECGFSGSCSQYYPKILVNNVCAQKWTFPKSMCECRTDLFVFMFCIAKPGYWGEGE